MAGGFTHITLCMHIINENMGLNNDLLTLLYNNNQFVWLGAISPDLPYLSLNGEQTKWADTFHEKSTNQVVLNSFNALRGEWPQKTESTEVKLAWLLGYVSHLIADATIHPIVQAIVGPYSIPENRDPHRICEMTQDSLIFHEINGIEITCSELSDYLKFCGAHDAFGELISFWTDSILSSYPNGSPDPDPKNWHSRYSKVIDFAEGGSGVAAFFRHVGPGEDYLYQKVADINADPKSLDKYYNQVKLPIGGAGNFLEYGFHKTAGHIIDAWNFIFQALRNQKEITSVVKNIHLDTGVDLDLPGDVVPYWEEGTA